MMAGKVLYILIDDDPIHNAITRLTIKNTVAGADIIMFGDSRSGLDFLSDRFKGNPAEAAVLLLNVNMPQMSGWDFLEEFSRLDSETKERLNIYLLSSSLSHSDEVRARDFKSVRGYLTKPLSKEVLLGL